MSANRVVDEHLVSPVLVYTSSGGVFKNELLLSAQGGLLREQIGNLLVVKNDFSVVSSLTGSVFSGPVIFSAGMTGSLQTLEDGSPYLRSGNGISIETGSDGSITIASDLASELQQIFMTTSSVYFGGDVYIEGTIFGGSPLDIGSSAVFHDSAQFLFGLTGSLTSLVDGSPYLVAGSGITISTGSTGQITISAETGSNQPNNTTVLTDIVLNETLTGPVDGINRVFYLNNTPASSDTVMVWMNGQLLTQGNSHDFSVSGSTVIFNSFSPLPGDVLLSMYSKASTIKRFSINENVTFINTSGSLSLSLKNVPDPISSLMLFRNGQLLTQNSDYTILGTSVSILDNAIKIDDIFLSTYSFV